MNPSIFIHGFWVIAVLVAASLISASIIMAWRSKPDMAVKWRVIKVISSLLGIVGLLLLLLNFEQVVRGEVTDKTREFAQEVFLEAKFLLSSQRINLCSKNNIQGEAKAACEELNTIDDQLSVSRVRDGQTFPMISTNNSMLADTVKQLNWRLTEINGANSGYEPPSFSGEFRIRAVMLAIFFVIIGLAGSIGESVFQYRQLRRI